MSFDGIVLAGGAAQRFDGVDKVAATIGERTLLDRVLGALVDAERIICVGQERATSVPVRWVQEDPPGSGPVAGLAAGLELVEASAVAVLAADLPFVTPAVVGRLVDAGARGAALASDENGIPQPLLAGYSSDVLRRRVREIEDLRGVAMRALLHGVPCVLVPVGEAALDCDTPADLAQARDRASAAAMEPKGL